MLEDFIFLLSILEKGKVDNKSIHCVNFRIGSSRQSASALTFAFRVPRGTPVFVKRHSKTQETLLTITFFILQEEAIKRTFGVGSLTIFFISQPNARGNRSSIDTIATGISQQITFFVEKASKKKNELRDSIAESVSGRDWQACFSQECH